MCYRICPSGGKRHWYDLEYCNYPCPSGSSNTGVTCRTNGWTRGKSCFGTCWPGNWCCRTACCGGCPAGYTNTGCFCEPCVTLASILPCSSPPSPYICSPCPQNCSSKGSCRCSQEHVLAAARLLAGGNQVLQRKHRLLQSALPE